MTVSVVCECMSVKLCEAL